MCTLVSSCSFTKTREKNMYTAGLVVVLLLKSKKRNL